MYNILEVEDKIKGLPDQALMREAQFPSGDVPQFLVVSEIQRRNEMRKSYDAMQQPSSTAPVAQQIVAEAGQGISGIVGGGALPVSAPMQAQTPMASPMQPPMPSPQAPSGIVGMNSGRRVPTTTSNMVAAVNAAIESLNSQGRDYTVYSQGELRRMGEEILGTNTIPSLVSQGFREFRPDLGADYELESMDYGFFSYDPSNPFNRAKDAIASKFAPSGAQSASRDIESEQRSKLGEYATQTGQPIRKYIRGDEGLGTLGEVLMGGYNLMGNYLGSIGPSENLLDQPTESQVYTGTIDRSGSPSVVDDVAVQSGQIDTEGLIDQSELDSMRTALLEESPSSNVDPININTSALSDSLGLAGFNIPAGRAVTTDISKLIDKEIFDGTGRISADDILSGLTRGAGDIELPAGADFASIAKARAERSETASTRMEELIQSIQDKAKSDALNMALINIGAGVASGDLAGGLERAGSVAGQISSDARDAARALELQQITMAEEGARSSEDIQMQEALSDLQRFSVEQGIAKDQRDYNLSLIRTKIESDLGLQKLAADLTQSENISKRSVLSLISDVIKEEAEAAENVGEPYDAASRALTLYNPFAGLFGLDSLSTAELNNAIAQMGPQSAVETDPADLESALDSFISR